jgi:ribulose bisphosphate carboxylase small subunit
MSKQKAAYEATSFEELSKLVDLETVKRALKALETSRLAHKQYYLRRSEILRKAKAAGITAD